MNSSEAATRTTAEQLERERAFHDTRFANNPTRNALLGSVTGPMTLDALTAVYHTVKPYCAGAEVLDYGCAEGEASLILRKYGAKSVHGIDISPVAVQHAEEAA